MPHYTTYREEQGLLAKARRENAHIRLRSGHGTQQVYVYHPGFMDATDPKVIRGEPIQLDEPVVIVNERVDPMGKIVWVVDVNGNEQSV